MSTRTKVILGLIAVGVVVAIGAAVAKGKQNKDVMHVSAEDSKVADLVSRVTCNGRIEAKKKVDLSATMSGQIVNLAVREGERVKKGDFLLQIDRTILQAQADSSKAALEALMADREASKANAERARLEFERAKSSYSGGVLSEQDFTRYRTDFESQRANYDAVERRIEQARASFVGARDSLQKTTITAPIEGVITRLPVEEGEVAIIGTMNNPGTALMTISDLSVIEALMEVDETEIPSVKVGQTATVTIDAYSGKTFHGVVTDIASSPKTIATASSATNTGVDFEVKVRLEDPPDGLRPGLSSTAEIVTGSKDKVVAVPIQALVLREKAGGKRGEEEEGVFLIEDGKAKFQPVKTGITGELDIEIAEGLAAGSKVITGPFKTLRELKEGSKVIVDPPPKAPTP
ncbi:MAG TPA: efflux RND transporter periplasmic adaptor subunit [Patescibacteria group bacterium]|nr:efflux RND transporter periplasmic adaptor subunit [Patescibacteria group bacterium]